MSKHACHTAAIAFILCASAVGAQPAPDRRPAQRPEDPFRFQLLGPSGGGRFSAVTGVPGNARIWYLGSASGGIWRSSDSGATFKPVFDSMQVQAIGALAVAPTSPNLVWAGTGEAWAIRDADVMGDGVYLSTDSGATWKNVGLRETGRIGRIIVHPTNPNIVFVCALGRVTGPQQERGVYRTTDRGKTWRRVLFVDEKTGCSGLTIDAKHPSVLFAGMWQVEMHTWAMFSGGPGSGIYVSRDGGTTWTPVRNLGLPKSPLGKIDVAVAPTDSRRVYALIQTPDQGSVWRSDDGGASWRVVNWTRALIGRAGYYIRLAVSPRDANEVLIANSSFFKSTDGGVTFQNVPWGGDNHDIWFDPKNADHFALTNDADARITFNHGKSFSNVSLPNGQMYHVAVDNQIPYWIYGNRQDNGTMRGPSTAPEAPPAGRGGLAQAGRGGRGQAGTRADSTPARRTPNVASARGRRDTLATADSSDAPGGGGFGGGRGGGFSTWDHGLGGCESGFTLPDPTDADIVWASCYGDEVTRWNAKTKQARSVSPWFHTIDSPPNDLKYRCHWTPPLAIDPFDHNTVYYGCQVIFATSNAGQSWRVVSPDLSTQDPSRIVSSGGIVGDNLGQFYGEVVFAIAPSEIQRGLIWAGTNDGQIWLTRDGTATWTNVTKNVSGLPPWGTIRKIEPSHFDPGTAYVAVDFHMMDDRRPYLYKTTDFGQTWIRLSDGLPNDHPLSYVMSVAENPNRKGMLFAGTGHAFFYSVDDGARWTQFQEGLPAAPVTWIVVPKPWNDVVVSTYGRGVFVLRDVAPLEQTGAQLASAGAHLFAPHPGYRQARSGHADITFSLATAERAPARVQILDSTGAVIRTMPQPTRAGLNRATWDLRYDGPKRVDLRTTPEANPHIWEEPRFKGRTVRPITHWGIEGPRGSGPLAVPGRYATRVIVGKDTTPAQPIEILRDPQIAASDADLVASTQAQIRIRDDLNAAAEMINKLEIVRKQIEDQRKSSTSPADITAALSAMDAKLLGVELRLLTRSDLNSDDKYYVEAYKVYLNLIWLSGEVGTGAGDVAGGADSRPTDTSLEILATIEKDLDAAKADYTKVMTEDVPAFNKAMSGKVTALTEIAMPGR
ncbi:MAG TPA: hypothetical protein VH539_08170 [Gemmatimonadaceae bacterium]